MEKYKTRQRDVLLNCLEENSDRALTVDEIIEILKNSGASVGKTTIYRRLGYLVDEGDVRRIISEDNSVSRYQLVKGHGECNEHFHLMCGECGALIHLSCDFMKDVGEHILEHHGFRVDNSKTVLYGRCRKCIEKSEGRK